jgi:hypothetical protein
MRPLQQPFIDPLDSHRKPNPAKVRPESMSSFSAQRANPPYGVILAREFAVGSPTTPSHGSAPDGMPNTRGWVPQAHVVPQLLWLDRNDIAQDQLGMTVNAIRIH